MELSASDTVWLKENWPQRRTLASRDAATLDQINEHLDESVRRVVLAVDIFVDLGLPA